MLPTAHVEKANTDRDDYERKSGNFLSSVDTREVRQVRFARLRPYQEEVLKIAEAENDRQIAVFYDPRGDIGKSFSSIHLWEQRDAFLVPRSDATAGKLSAFICSSYRQERYIIIDVPRASTIDRGMYEVLEDTKDGMVFDHRWQGRARNIRGARIIVYSNAPVNPDMLSWDRWIFRKWNHDMDKWDTLSVNQMREIYEYVNPPKNKRKKSARGGTRSEDPPLTPPTEG